MHHINSDIMAIIDASREQSLALGNINHAINEVDQGTQQNAAMVEQQTAASRSLAHESQALFALLEQFHFGQTGARAATPAPAPATPRPVQKPLRAAPQFRTAGSAALAVEPGWEDF